MEGAGPLAVENPHGRHIEHYRVVYIAHHFFNGVGHPFAADVYLRTEGELALFDGRVAAQKRRVRSLFYGRTVFVRCDLLDTVPRNTGGNIAYRHCYRLLGHLDNLADKAAVLDADFLADGHRAAAERRHLPFGLLLGSRHGRILPGAEPLFAGFAGAPLLQVADLPVEILLAVLAALAKGAYEAAKLLAGLLGRAFVGLGLAYGADGVLDLAVGVADYLLGLLLRLVEDALAEGADVLEFPLIAVGDVLEGLVCGAYFLELFIQGPPVARNAAQVFLYADIFLPGPHLGILDYRLRNADLARQCESEGASRHAGLELEEGLYLLRIEEHGPVDDGALRRRGVKLEVGVVGRNDTVGAAGLERGEDSLGYGAARRRLSPGAELVDEHQGLAVGLGEHLFHVLKEG